MYYFKQAKKKKKK